MGSASGVGGRFGAWCCRRAGEVAVDLVDECCRVRSCGEGGGYGVDELVDELGSGGGGLGYWWEGGRHGGGGFVIRNAWRNAMMKEQGELLNAHLPYTKFIVRLIDFDEFWIGGMSQSAEFSWAEHLGDVTVMRAGRYPRRASEARPCQ